MEDRPQKELFEFKEGKKPFPGIGRIFPKDAIGITLSLERLIFLSIGLVLALVLVYAIGVERGKRLGRNPSLAMLSVEKSAAPAPGVQKGPSQAAEREKASKLAMKAFPTLAKLEAVSGQAAGKPYTIVAATFSNRRVASDEMNHLKKDGFDAFLSESDPYFQVCIGAYSSRASAQPSLKKVKQRYLDAYIKLK